MFHFVIGVLLIAPKLTKLSVSFELVDAKVDSNLNSDFQPDPLLIASFSTVSECEIKLQFHYSYQKIDYVCLGDKHPVFARTICAKEVISRVIYRNNGETMKF